MAATHNGGPDEPRPSSERAHEPPFTAEDDLATSDAERASNRPFPRPSILASPLSISRPGYLVLVLPAVLILAITMLPTSWRELLALGIIVLVATAMMIGQLTRRRPGP